MSAEIIVDYCRRFPGLAVTDVFKFLSQSCLGCEHLVADESRAISMIWEELPRAAQDCTRGIEPLDGPYVRLHLDAVEAGLSPETLGKLFVLSSKNKAGGYTALSEKLDALQALAADGKLPFPAQDVAAAAEQWRKANFPACHHSESFRRLYHPAYRVLWAEYVRILPLLQAIDARLKSGSLIVAVDGRCASGKTTLGRLLAELYDCNVFHMDDFFLQPHQRAAERLAIPGENVDHERFLEEVLLPLSKGNAVSYRRYDCHLGKMGDPVAAAPKKLAIVEGAYCLHDSLADYYDLAVFSDVSEKEQKERILARNSAEVACRFFEQWIPLEERYFSSCNVRKKAELILC